MTTKQTTVKVTREVRERITKAAGSQHIPANEFLDRLLSDWERRQRMSAVAAAMNSASETQRSDYEQENELWDSTLTDGLRP